jgi:CDP-glucose 4,6-dehydratase
VESLDKSFWKNKKVLVTGHTGFKGGWLCHLLKILGAEVHGYSLFPNTSPNLYELSIVQSTLTSELISDIRSSDFHGYLKQVQPDIILHLAAQPLVLESYIKTFETFDVNVMGTINVLEAIKTWSSTNLKVFINVTTDKVYENKNMADVSYRETDNLMGYDPYSASKVCSEIVTDSYYKSFLKQKKIGVATVRAGNVIGGGDFSKNRIVPDIFRAFKNGTGMSIRNPKSVRPWQFVLDPLSGYLQLAQNLYYNQTLSGSWNFGPNVEDIMSVIDFVKNIVPNELINIDYSGQKHEFDYLNLDSTKAKVLLHWKPRYKLDKSCELIYTWYNNSMGNYDMRAITIEQIEDYLSGD